MVRVLIAESLDVETFTPLIQMCKEIEFIYQPDISEEELEKELKNYHGVIVRPKTISAKAIIDSPHLKLIVRGGAGVNSIDLAAAKKQGVIVENTPGLNSIATAEYSFALMTELVANRHIRRSYHDVLTQKTTSPEDYFGQELAAKSIGIIGLGNIGMKMARRCTAFEMKVYGYNRSVKAGEFVFCHSLEALLENQLDIISIHVPLNEHTQGMVNDKFYHQLKSNIVLINTARPQLMEVGAFKKALDSAILTSGAIDGDLDLIEPFIKMDTNKKCVFTHHIADATKESRQAITKKVIVQTIEFFINNNVINQV